MPSAQTDIHSCLFRVDQTSTLFPKRNATFLKLPKFWAGKVTTYRENAPQHMKLHYCSCISIAILATHSLLVRVWVPNSKCGLQFHMQKYFHVSYHRETLQNQEILYIVPQITMWNCFFLFPDHYLGQDVFSICSVCYPY